MRLVLLTNMPSTHQVQLGVQFARLLGENNFRLVFEKNTSDDRAEMGWNDHYSASFIIRMWESADNQALVEQWIKDADVVIQGRFPMHFVRARIGAGKLTFAYQERFWKRKFGYARALLRLPRIVKRYWSVNRKNYHLLAAGAYVAPDLAMLGCFRGRSWKYGYFISAGETSTVSRPLTPRVELLWCARFSPVKRAEDALHIVKGLVDRGMDCHLTMVGDGFEKSRIELLAKRQQLTSWVSFSGWKSEQEVADIMQRSDIFLMTSGPGEGWALVINEAMNNACAIVANNSVGAAPWLVDENETGFLYAPENLNSVLDTIAQLSVGRIREMGNAAAQQHAQTWSANIAAQRLVALSRCLLDKDIQSATDLFRDGPCSPT